MSMKASLGVLSDVEERTVAILGDMGELGENEAALHREVGEAAGEMSIDAFVLGGKLAKNIAEGIRSVNPDAEILWFATVDEALAEIKDVVRPGDVVLVKASHFMHFDRIVSELTV
jgi:UDP-N-acetylmuramoyl-tripeptide--D-alanyl-D-alanine ligase